MFESWVSDLLASSLGHFIDVQRDQLRISLWHGVVIENARLRTDAFDYLQFPFKVNYGCIGRLQLQVPWRALRSSPIVVELSDVTLSCTPWDEHEWSGEASIKRARAAKQAQVAAAELEKLSTKVAADRGGDGRNFRWILMTSLWSLLLRRLQLSVSNVHIFFQTVDSDHQPAATFGLRLGSLETQHEDQEVERKRNLLPRSSPAGEEIVKVLSFSGLFVYWIPTAPKDPMAAMQTEFEDADYLMKPVDLCFWVYLHPCGPSDPARLQFQVHGDVRDVHLQMSSAQLIGLAHLSEDFAIWSRRCQFGKFRPQGWRTALQVQTCKEATTTSAPVGWRSIWQYATKSVMQELRILQPGSLLSNPKLWQQWHRQYDSLYRRHVEALQTGASSGHNYAAELADLETDLPVAAIMLFRSLAERRMEHRSEGERGEAVSDASRWRSWVGWGMSGVWGLLGYMSYSSSEPSTLPEPPSERDIAQFYEALGIQPSSQPEGRYAPAPILASMTVEVGSIEALLRDDHFPIARSRTLVSVGFANCESKLELEAGRFRSSVAVADLSVCDWCSCPGVSECIVSRHEGGPASPAQSKKIIDSHLGLASGKFPAMYIAYDSADDGKGKMRVRVDPLKLVYRPRCIGRLLGIARKFPKGTWHGHMLSCISSLKSRRAQILAKAQLMSYIPPLVGLEVELHDFLLCFPSQDVLDEPPLLSCHFDFLGIVSNPTTDVANTQRILRRIQAAAPMEATDEKSEAHHLLQVMLGDLESSVVYRRSEVQLKGLQVFLSHQEQGSSSVRFDTLISKLSMNADLELSRVPQAASSPAFRMSCRCTDVGITFTGMHIAVLENVVQALAADAQIADRLHGQEGEQVSWSDVVSGGQGTKVFNTGEQGLKKCAAKAQDGKKLGTELGEGEDCSLESRPGNTIGFELSVTTSKLKIAYNDAEVDVGYFCLGGTQELSCKGMAKNSTLSIAVSKEITTVSCSFSDLTVHDTSKYGGKVPRPKGDVCRMAKGLSVHDFTLSHKAKVNGDFHVTGKLAGIEIMAFPSEVGGYVKSCLVDEQAIATFSFRHQETNRLELMFQRCSFGSTFLQRLVAQFANEPESCSIDDEKHVRDIEGGCISSSAEDTAVLAADWGKHGRSAEDLIDAPQASTSSLRCFSLVMSFVDCAMVIPKGGQEMAIVLSLPGSHAGMMLQLPFFECELAFLTRVLKGVKAAGCVEVGHVALRDAKLFATVEPQSYLLSPVVEIPSMGVVSKGGITSQRSWPYNCGQVLDQVVYNVSLSDIGISFDNHQVEVAMSAFAEILERAALYFPESEYASEPCCEMHRNNPVAEDTVMDSTQKEELAIVEAPHQQVDVFVDIASVHVSLDCSREDDLETHLHWAGAQMRYRWAYSRELLCSRGTSEAPSQDSDHSDCGEARSMEQEAPHGVHSELTAGGGLDKGDGPKMPATGLSKPCSQPGKDGIQEHPVGVACLNVTRDGSMSWDCLTVSIGTKIERVAHHVGCDGRLAIHTASAEQGMPPGTLDRINTPAGSDSNGGTGPSPRSAETTDSILPSGRRSLDFHSMDEELESGRGSRASSIDSDRSFSTYPVRSDWADPGCSSGGEEEDYQYQSTVKGALLLTLSTTTAGGCLRTRSSHLIAHPGLQECPTSGTVPSTKTTIELDDGLKVQLNTSGWMPLIHSIEDGFAIAGKYPMLRTGLGSTSSGPSASHHPLGGVHCSVPNLELHLCDFGFRSDIEVQNKATEAGQKPCLLAACSRIEMAASPSSVSGSLAHFVLSTGWTAGCPHTSSEDWVVTKNNGGLLKVEKLRVQASPPAGVSSSTNNSLGFNWPLLNIVLSLDVLGVSGSYQRLGAFQHFVQSIRQEYAQLPDMPDISDMGSPQDDRSTLSTRSSMFPFFQGQAPSQREWSEWPCAPESVVVTLGSARFLFIDDRTQTILPYLESAIEGLEFEAKREQNSELVAWSFQLAPHVNLYNRHKMGWEPLCEDWAVRVDGQTHMRHNGGRHAPRPQLCTVLRCTADQTLEMTVSPGMLECMGVLHDAIRTAITSWPAAGDMPCCDHSSSPHLGSLFTTHWLDNKTGCKLDFWTSRQGLGVQMPQKVQEVWRVDAEEIVPLRAVAVGDMQTISMGGKPPSRPMSLTEMSFALPAASSVPIQAPDSTDPPLDQNTGSGSRCDERGETMPWFAQDFEQETDQVAEISGVKEQEYDDLQDATGQQEVSPSPECAIDDEPVSSGFPRESGVDILDCQFNSLANFSRHRRMHLYFQLDGQVCACGPCALDRVGTTKHLISLDRAIGDPEMRLHSGIAASPAVVEAEIVCEVLQKKVGGFNVQLRSNVGLLNDTAWRLEVGCWHARSTEPQSVRGLAPGEEAWLPVKTAVAGWICIRPCPESTDPWALQCAWSQPVVLQELYGMLRDGRNGLGVLSHLRCDPTAGGVKPVWLFLGAKRSREGSLSQLHILPPVVVRNYLPVPTDVSLLVAPQSTPGPKARVEPRSHMDANTVLGNDVCCIRFRPEGFSQCDVDSIPPINDHSEFGHTEQAGLLSGSFEDVSGEDVTMQVSAEGHSGVPVRIRHYVHGFTGSHVFELCCAFWVYNCAGIPIALRESRGKEPVVEEEAVRLPEDRVPKRWIPPFIGKADARQASAAAGAPGSTASVPISGKYPASTSSSSQQPLSQMSSSTDLVGLGSAVRAGEATDFKIRTGWVGPSQQSTSDRQSVRKRGSFAGTRWPWIEGANTPRHGRLRLQLRSSMAQAPQGGDYWSGPVSLDALGGAAVVQVPCPIQGSASKPAFPAAAYFFSVTAVPIPQAGGAWALHIMPRYVLHNTLNVNLRYRQQGIPIERELPSGARRNMHWPDASRPLRLNFRVQEAGWLWSGGILLDSPGDMFVKIRHRHREETILVGVDVSTSRSGVLTATLSRQEGFAPYRLDNFTSEKLHIRQESWRDQEDILRPYSSVPFAWDEPAAPHRVVLELAGRQYVGTFNLDEVGYVACTRLPPSRNSTWSDSQRRIRVIIDAEGPTRVMAVIDEEFHPRAALADNPSRTEHLDWKGWSSPSLATIGRKSSSQPSYSLEVTVHLYAVGLSLVSSTRELLYAWVGEPQLRFTVSKIRYTFECSVNRFQLDNCMGQAVYPVMARGPLSRNIVGGWQGSDTSRLGLSRANALGVRTSIWRRRPGGVVCVEQLHVHVAPFALEFEEQHIWELVSFFENHVERFGEDWGHMGGRPGGHEPDVIALDGGVWEQATPKSKVYFEHLHVSRLEMTVSFCPTTSRLSTQDGLGGSSGAAGVLLQRFIALADVEGARIRLTALDLKHPLLSQHAFKSLVGRHYTKALLQEVYKVVGSADILGDPTRLIHHLGLGVWSLVANPAAALVEAPHRGPLGVAVGLGSGVRSLLANTIFGFSNATAKMSLAAWKGLVVLGLEDESRLRMVHRGRWREVVPGEEVDSGLPGALLGGLAGVLRESIQGAQAGGPLFVVGFLRGAVRGAIYALVRPLAATLEMSSRIADSVRLFVSGYPAPFHQIRIPRSIDPAAALQPYDHLEAVGNMLASDPQVRKHNGVLLGCVNLSGRNAFAVITHRHLLTISLTETHTLQYIPEVKLALPLDDVEYVKLMPKEVRFLALAPGFREVNRFNRPQLARSPQYPYVTGALECDEGRAAYRLGSLLLYARRHTARHLRPLGHGFLVDNRPAYRRPGTA